MPPMKPLETTEVGHFTGQIHSIQNTAHEVHLSQ